MKKMEKIKNFPILVCDTCRKIADREVTVWGYPKSPVCQGKLERLPNNCPCCNSALTDPHYMLIREGILFHYDAENTFVGFLTYPSEVSNDLSC